MSVNLDVSCTVVRICRPAITKEEQSKGCFRVRVDLDNRAPKDTLANLNTLNR